MVTVPVNLAIMKDKYCILHRYGRRVKLSQVKIFVNPVLSSVCRSDKRICYQDREQR